jgi:hypothetical protein
MRASTNNKWTCVHIQTVADLSTDTFIPVANEATAQDISNSFLVLLKILTGKLKN